MAHPSSASTFVSENAEILSSVLKHLKIASVVHVDFDSEASISAETAGQNYDVIPRSRITTDQGENIAWRYNKNAKPLLLVAARISAGAKEYFDKFDISYLDLRGELRIAESPIGTRTFHKPDISEQTKIIGPLDSEVSKEVAIACLLAPDHKQDVIEIARYINRSPSSVSSAIGGLQNVGLLTTDRKTVIPDLFYELSDRWHKKVVPLACLPEPTSWNESKLCLGFDLPETTSGWAATNAIAASSWGIANMSDITQPPDFYVPSETVLQAARSELVEIDDSTSHACTIAVAPVRLVCFRRVAHSPAAGQSYPIVNHVVLALDLAQDKHRGMEILKRWKSPSITKVW